MPQVIRTPIKPRKQHSPILRKCFGTDFSHRLFETEGPRVKNEPRKSIGSICPNCGLPLCEWSEAAYKKANLVIPALDKISPTVLPPHVIEEVSLIEPSIIAAHLLRKPLIIPA